MTSSTTLPTRVLGTAGPRVSALGLGCMGMSELLRRGGPRGDHRHHPRRARRRHHPARHRRLLRHGPQRAADRARRCAAGARDDVLLSVKFGALRDPDGASSASTPAPRRSRTSSPTRLTRLGTDHVDIYRPARLDPAVPIEDTVGAIAELVEAGYVRHIGLSEVGADTLRRAHAVHPIADLQIEYSLITRGLEAEILPAVPRARHRRHRLRRAVARAAQRPLDAGARAGAGDFRAHAAALHRRQPRREPRAGRGACARVAERAAPRVAQVAIAWVLARGDDIVPLVGARTRERLTEALGALDIELDADDLAAIEAAVPADAVAGARYDAAACDARQRDGWTHEGDGRAAADPERILDAAEERAAPASARRRRRSSTWPARSA